MAIGEAKVEPRRKWSFQGIEESAQQLNEVQDPGAPGHEMV